MRRFGTCVCLFALFTAGCVRIPFNPSAAVAPTITVSFIDVTTPGTAADYEDVTDSQTLYIPAGKKFNLIVRADGSDGVTDLEVGYSIGGSPAAIAIVSDPIDGNGYVATSLVILGTDGSGHAGNQPIQFQLSSGQLGLVTAAAVAPPSLLNRIQLQLKADCGCPRGANFDRNCNCGCPLSAPSNAAPVLTDEPLSPLCGGLSCCAGGEQCFLGPSGQMCGLPGPGQCQNGVICPRDRPICRYNVCWPF